MHPLEMFSYGFMQRAFLAGTLVSVSCSVLGVFLVLRREAMIGHGLAHVTFGGVALALFLNYSPLPVALIFSLVAAWLIEYLKKGAKLGGDTGIGIVSSLGMAGGIMLASLAGDFNSDLLSFLFGSVLAISPLEVWIAGGLAVLVLILLAFSYNELIYAAFDEQSARVSGIEVKRLDLILTSLTAVTVVIGMKVVGLLLVAALMVIPAASGLLVAYTFRQTIMGAVIFSALSVIIGLLLSFLLDLPASGTIVLVNGLFLGCALITRSIR